MQLQEMQGPKCNQNIMQGPTCKNMAKCNATGQMHAEMQMQQSMEPNTMLNKRQACNKAIKGPTCNLKNMQGLECKAKDTCKHTTIGFQD